VLITSLEQHARYFLLRVAFPGGCAPLLSAGAPVGNAQMEFLVWQEISH